MDIATITSAYTAIKNIKEISKLALDAKIDSEVSGKIQASIERLGEVQDTLFIFERSFLLSKKRKKSSKRNSLL
ncbi:TPA: hypothetical protein NKP21_004406 [Vibrio parahaemolyticus]|nr:hypothetical protein [Vibrio parahaemolyticus]HCH1054348.1 hypothetical protein [Vibrio parahaemolyticus]